MPNLVKIYFVVSTVNHRTRKVSYNLSDNLAELSRSARRVFGTGHYDEGIVLSRLRKCRAGEWFGEQHRARKLREREDTRQRKSLHAQYLRTLKRAKA